MDGDDFQTSLQQLRLQLDLMNKRTASILDKSHQHPNKVTHNSTQVGHFTPAMADNAQQIKHIGATVGALARQQEDGFHRLEGQLNLLSDKLEHLALADPQFTPPESSTSYISEDSEPYPHLSSDESSHMPRQTHGIPSATVADVGGYFYPNYAHYSRNNQQHISDALTFVGRVNRTLRTKTINNIEMFLRGSALRWFHIGLRIDGSHIFDYENGDMNISKFCQSLILLFGVPKSSRPESQKEAANLVSSSMRSVIIDDYAFPALENARLQGADFDFDVVLSKAIKVYNQSSMPFTMNPDIVKNKDLLEMLVSLRCSEFDQRIDKALAQKRQRFDGTTPAKAPVKSTKKAGAAGNQIQQDSLSASVAHHRNLSSITTEACVNPPIAKSDNVRIEINMKLPAACDCRDETMLDPLEHKQKMRQCINFLADKGVENLPDFEQKLAALKDWLHKNHSHGDSDDETKMLWRRVAYMIWINENRIVEDAEQRFVDAQNQDSRIMHATKKPEEKQQGCLVSDSDTIGGPESFENQIVQAPGKVYSLSDRFVEATAAEARIKKLDSMNPGTLHTRSRPTVVDSIEATEPRPPAPTAESCPATPIVPCKRSVSPLNQASQMRDVHEQLQEPATMGPGVADHSIPVSPETAKKFGLQPGRQPTQQQSLQIQQQMRMQQLAQQQQKALESDGFVQSERSSRKLFRQQSSALGTHESRGYSRPDERLYAPQQTDNPERDVEADVSSSEQDTSLFTPSSGASNESEAVPSSNKMGYTMPAVSGGDCDAKSNFIIPISGTANPTTIPMATESKADSLDIAEGAENCLTGLKFVFTGRFNQLSREDGQKLVKRYGGKWRATPSKSTDYVVLGSDVNPNKHQYIKKHNLRTIDEKGLLNLIRMLPPCDAEKLSATKTAKKHKKAVDDSIATATPDHEYDSSSTAAGLRRWAQRAAEIKEKHENMENWVGRAEWKSYDRFHEELAAAASAPVENILTTITHGFQRDTSSINPYLFYESGCAAIKSSMGGNTTHLELGPLDDQDCTDYAQMLEDHAAAVAGESIDEAELFIYQECHRENFPSDHI